MKKTLIIAILASFSLVACKKDHTCSCSTTTTTTYFGTTNTTTTVDDITIIKAKKSDAKKACVSTKTSDSGTNYSYTSESTCKLK